MTHQLKSSEKSWNLKMTQFAIKTDNPLRKIWENHKVFPNPRKETITLQIGEHSVEEMSENEGNIIKYLLQVIRQCLEIFLWHEKVFQR